MNNNNKTKEQFLNKIGELNRKIADLEKSKTKHKQIEESLREKTETISTIVDTSQEWIWAIDLQGIHTYSNPAIKQILGYPPDKLVGKPSFDLMHDDDRQMIATKLPLWISEKSGWKSLVIRWRHSNGSWRYLESSAVPIIDTNGDITGFRGVDRDITERKQADRLQSVVYQIIKETHSTKNLNELYKEIHASLMQVLDVTNFYIAIYDEKVQMLSFPFFEDEVDDFPENAEPFGNGLTEYVIKTGEALLLNKEEIEAYRREGKIELVGAISELWMGSPLKIGTNVIGVIAVNSYHDPNLYTESDLEILNFVATQIAQVIEHKQTITDLEVEKIYLDELFTSSPEALALVATDSTILDINKQFTTLFGYSEDEVLGRNIDELLTAPEHRDNARKITKDAAMGKHQYLDTVRKKKDGTMIAVSVLGSPVNYKGDTLAVYGIYRDITERTKVTEILKKSEEQYRALSEELTESNSMKELLLDVIAHDLRNPAGVIKGFAEFGLEMDPNNEILKEIDGGVNNLLNVIRNATTLSKVALGDSINKEELDLMDIINTVVKENLPQFEFAEMTLDMKIEEKLIINANPIIGEVFRNYISNAIKYGKSGKKVIINTIVDNGYVTVNVKDFGETINEQDRDNIFMRNVQLGKTKGRGLGLAIVARIAEAHDAKVGVKPNKPNGNIFYIKIPVS